MDGIFGEPRALPRRLIFRGTMPGVVRQEPRPDAVRLTLLDGCAMLLVAALACAIAVALRRAGLPGHCSIALPGIALVGYWVGWCCEEWYN